jgi:uncharacterized membrane protein
MPLSFAVAWAGHLIGGDFRLGHLAALTAAAGLIACCGSGSLPALAAALLLLTPREFFVLDFGWSEPAVLLCLAFLAFCSRVRPRWTPWAAGLAMVSKQDMILAVPALILLMPRPLGWKPAAQFLAKALVAGAAVTLPLVLWNVRAFLHSAVVEILNNPARPDSLNLAEWMGDHGYAPLPPWLPYVVAAIAGAAAVWRAPRNAGGFCAAVAVIHLSFFAFAKQAFGNYYFLTIGALCCAVAAGSALETTRTE